jgi:hypothetical protein
VRTSAELQRLMTSTQLQRLKLSTRACKVVGASSLTTAGEQARAQSVPCTVEEKDAQPTQSQAGSPKLTTSRAPPSTPSHPHIWTNLMDSSGPVLIQRNNRSTMYKVSAALSSTYVLQSEGSAPKSPSQWHFCQSSPLPQLASSTTSTLPDLPVVTNFHLTS